MSSENIKSRHSPGLGERIRFAATTFMAILLNRPVIVCIGEGTIYARSNPYYMHAFAKMMVDACEAHTNEMLEDHIRRLLTEIQDERKN